VPAPEPRSRYGNPPFYEELGRRYVVLETAAGYTERGVASWYGKKFHGRRTSSGDTYDMHAMSAAHKTLPLPTWAEVRNLRNGRTVIVRVNDRGPFVENRIIDLSYEAAKRLDIISDGTGLVEVRALSFDRPAGTGPEVVEPVSITAATTATENLAGDAMVPTPPPETASDTPEAPKMYVQVGAFSERTNAAGLHLRLKQTGFDNAIIHQDALESPEFYRVRIGPIEAVDEYDQVVQRLQTYGIADVNMIIE